MQVLIKRIDPTVALPIYQTPGSAAFDLASNTDMDIAPHSVALIPTGLVIGAPPGHFLAIAPRSSTPKKKGLSIPHGVGVVDSDYCGDGDEIKIQVYNFTDAPVPITKGERIAQGLILPVVQAEWKEVEKMGDKDRGGFGSTGF